MPTTEQATETLGTAVKAIGDMTIWDIAFIVVLIVICIVVSKIILAALGKMLERSKVEKTLHTVIKSVVRILLIFLSVLIVADRLGIPVTSLIALLSVAGLALSLAIQGVLSNIAGGIMILWAKPFQVGDFIDTGGASGTVQDINLVYTKILTPDNRVVYLTNKSVSDSKITNVTVGGTRRVDLTITASYDAPIETVKECIRKVLSDHPLTMDDPAPFVRVSNYGESAIEYTVRAWCAAGDYWTVYFDVLEGIKAAFDSAGVEMTYPHVNVHMVEKG